MTHAVTYLPQVDQVMVMRDGRLVERGSYSQLVAAAEGEFAQLVLQYLHDMDGQDVQEGIMYWFHYIWRHLHCKKVITSLKEFWISCCYRN